MRLFCFVKEVLTQKRTFIEWLKDIWDKIFGKNKVPAELRHIEKLFGKALTEAGENAKTKSDKTNELDSEYGEQFSIGDITPVTEAENKELEKHFGTTGNFKVAGYLLTDGKLLDFSGKHWGDTTSRTRQVDHRDVQEVLNRGNNGIDDMVSMIGSGNIRLMPENGGINLAVYPNEKQRKVLSTYINYMLNTEGEVVIDYDAVGGDTVYSKVYGKTATSRQILNDIRNYFNGARPSELMSFHTDEQFSISDNARDDIKKVLSDKNYQGEVRLTDNSPSIMLAQKGVRNLPMLMNASHIRENIFTEAEAEKLGLKINPNINYHGLGEELFFKVIAGLDNVNEAYRGTKNAENPARRENYFLLISEYKDKDGNTINVPIYINEKGLYNRVFIDTNKLATIFGKEGLRGYLNREIQKKNLVRIKNRNTQTSESTSPINADYEMSASNDSISPDFGIVNRENQKSEEQHSIPEKSSDGQKLTDEQRRYFRNSKVRDEKGRLLAVYHGTKRAGFTTFTKTDDKKPLSVSSSSEAKDPERAFLSEYQLLIIVF